MGTITLPNVRATSDITARVRLKYSGVAIDWTGLRDIKAYIYADEQKAIAGRCAVSIDEEDKTILVCDYAATKPQYLGVNRIIIQAKYYGRTNTYDKAAFNIVARNSDLAEEEAVVEDTSAEESVEVHVSIEVTQVSTSLLDNAIAAAIKAAGDAEEAAHLVPLQVLQDCREATEDAQEAKQNADAAADEARAAGAHSVPIIDEETGNWARWDAELGRYVDTGKPSRGIQGPQGVSIQSIEQTQTSDESEGENEVTVTLDNGQTATFVVRNGAQGIQGAPGVANAKYRQVASLPVASAETMDFIYLTESATTGIYNMSYTEYDPGTDTYSWHSLGTTAIQLSDYATKEELSQLGQEIPKLFIACNENNCVNGYFSTANGTTIGGATDGISVASLNYLSVLPGYSVLFDNPNNYLVAYYFYDKNRQFISGSAVWFSSITEIVIPDGVYYVRFAFRLSTGLTKDTVNVLVLRKIPVVDNIVTDNATAALSARQGKLLGEIQAQNFLYWGLNNKPQFTLNGDASSSVDITFPNRAFAVYNRNGVSILGNVSTLNNLTINVPTAQKLILHKTTKAYAVVALNATPTDDEILLFSNTYQNAFDGLLAPYYYMQKLGELKNNTGVSAYFIRAKNPQFSISGTTLKIRMPIASENSSLRIYSATDGVLINGIPTADQVYEIPTTYKLVYDLSDASIKVVAGNVCGSFIDLLTNNNLNITGPLASYYLQYQNSIPHLYYNQNERVILQNLQKKNVTGTSESGLPPLILLHFSDIHENGANLQRIMDYHTMFSDFFADILNTGDNINVGTDSYDFYTDVDGTENILTAIGNHDVSNGNSGVDIYNKEIAPFVSSWGVVQPANAGTLGLCYYYKDYTTSKIRLIVLDNFASDMSAQASWLADVLADAKTNDLCVVCAGHFPCPMNLLKESTFCSLDGGTQANPMQSALIDAVSTFIAGGGKFACWITGHTHEDLFGKVIDHPEQVCITVSSASQSRNAGSAARILGTKSQDSFNIISIDENTHCLKVHKVGADMDRYLRHIGEMCYNYQTGTLIYND